MFANGEFSSMDEGLLKAASGEFRSDSNSEAGVEVALGLACVAPNNVTNVESGAFFRIIANDVEQIKVNHVSHIGLKTTMMSAMLVTTVYADNRHFVMSDLRNSASQMRRTLTTLRQWKQKGVSPMPYLIALRSDTFGCLSDLDSPAPPIVDAGGTHEGTHAVSLVHAASAMRLSAERQLSGPVCEMVKKNAVDGVGGTPWSEVDALHWGTVGKMYHAGMITRRENELGDVLISLKSEAIVWTSVAGLEKPEIAKASAARGLKPSHRPKLQLAVELINQGFERGAPLCALEDGANLIFSKSWAMATMYFVSLVCRREIWGNQRSSSRTIRRMTSTSASSSSTARPS